MSEEQRRGPFAATILVLAGLFAAFSVFSTVWADYSWFSSVGEVGVFVRGKAYQFGTFGVVFVLTFLILSLALRVAYQADGPSTIPEQIREGIEPFRRLVFWLFPLGFALLIAFAAGLGWTTVVQYINGGTFGSVDAHFGKDLGFYVFDLPMYRMILGLLLVVVMAGLIGNVAVHYFFDGFQAPSARRHLLIGLGLLALVKAGSYWADRYALLTRDGSLVTGMQYTDANALVPAKTLLMFIAGVVALLCFISIFRSGWNLPYLAFGAMLASAAVVGGIYPIVVQQFQVRPSELAREADYLARNIDATRASYGLQKVQITDYAALEDPKDAKIEGDKGTISHIRLLDPNVVSPTFRNLQQIRSFYAFPDSLDIDRYQTKSGPVGTVLAVREVDLAGVAANQRNWFNDHMVYTHGYGIVAAKDSVAATDGTPAFLESDIPPVGSLNITEPRVYFGEKSPDYSIVGAPKGTDPRELDYPDDTSANGQASNTYAGQGGVGIGNIFMRAVFAMHFKDPNILLSNQVNADSKVLYGRDPETRVSKVAPWLTLDSDPYPAVVDGRIVWIVDGYTTSNAYPYAERVSLSDVTADSMRAGESNPFMAQHINYIQNAVKATVDAYDGTVRLYAWQESDPVLKAWMQAFPGVVQPKSAMPTALLEHVRYPEDLFKVQRDVLARYHVTDPKAFYSGQDFWTVPDDPTKPDIKQAQPPYYLTLRMPDQKSPAFALTSTFAPTKRQTLAAFMSVVSDPGSEYGAIRVLQLPRNTTIPGPTQVQNNFESDPDVSARLSLLRKGGSDVTLGNLLSLPVGGGLLYVEPVYVRASSGEGYPLLRMVLVSFGTKVAFEDDLGTALQVIFGAAPSPTEPTPTDPNAALAAAIKAANQAYADAQAALTKGDFTAYGAAQARLKKALADVTAAAGNLPTAQ